MITMIPSSLQMGHNPTLTHQSKPLKILIAIAREKRSESKEKKRRPKET